ncbi:MAG TPA: universal stress protein, partial [Myxococcales bacterium]|nr:universal stress protein [Myxococcales bacterium]
GIQSVLLGNTAERVIHNAPCSLMIIKPEMTS